MKFYAVKIGKIPGIYTDWESCKKQVHGFSGAQYKSFSTIKEAENYLKDINVVEEDDVVNDRDVIYTDGSCIDKVGGWSWVWVKKSVVLENKGRVPGESTNQIAELYAIWKSVTECSSSNIDIYTDSQYCIGCLTTWWKNWQRNGWRNSKGEAVANQELIQAILSALLSKDVRFYHVRGHRGNRYNELCDRLANEGRTM
jgi:ribonuclease HI